MEKRTKRYAVGTLVALGVGYVAGILTAPKSGKETRKDIQKAAIKAKSEAEKRLKTLHSELGDAIDQGKTKLTGVKDKAQTELQKAMDSAGSVQQKVRDLLSAVHEGDADSKDLQKAISEATKAVQHLRKYLKSHA